MTLLASGFQFADPQVTVLSWTLTQAARESLAGSRYAIAQGTVAANGNYTISLTTNRLTVNRFYQVQVLT